MPLRTTPVVAVTMVCLAFIGVVTIFGNAILAVVAPGAEPQAATNTLAPAGPASKPADAAAAAAAAPGTPAAPTPPSVPAAAEAPAHAAPAVAAPAPKDGSS